MGFRKTFGLILTFTKKIPQNLWPKITFVFFSAKNLENPINKILIIVKHFKWDELAIALLRIWNYSSLLLDKILTKTKILTNKSILNNLADFSNMNKEFLLKNPPKKFLPKKSSPKNPPKKFLPKNSSSKNPPKKFP